MKLGQDILYLSNSDIERCDLGPAEVERAIETMFAAKAAGAAHMKPKLSLNAPETALFLASPGVMDMPPYAGIKWVSVADNQIRGLPHIAGTIILNDAASGMPVAVLDARWITGLRTAAITAVAARHRARPDSTAIGLVACGLQARAHLAALRRHFPLVRLRAFSRRLTTAMTFAEMARSEGVADAAAVADPREAIANCDIVVSSTPVVPRPAPFLDAGWLARGSFAALVDLGASWIPETLAGLDRVVTDDLAQAETERLSYPNPYDGEVADLVAARAVGRQTAEERTALVFAGIGLADVAVGALVYDRAAALGIGRVLPL